MKDEIEDECRVKEKKVDKVLATVKVGIPISCGFNCFVTARPVRIKLSIFFVSDCIFQLLFFHYCYSYLYILIFL